MVRKSHVRIGDRMHVFVYAYKTTPYPMDTIFQSFLPVLHAQCSTLVLYALNMPTYAFWFAFFIPICMTDREKHQPCCTFKVYHLNTC